MQCRLGGAKQFCHFKWDAQHVSCTMTGWLVVSGIDKRQIHLCCASGKPLLTMVGSINSSPFASEANLFSKSQHSMRFDKSIVASTPRVKLVQRRAHQTTMDGDTVLGKAGMVLVMCSNGVQSLFYPVKYAFCATCLWGCSLVAALTKLHAPIICWSD